MELTIVPGFNVTEGFQFHFSGPLISIVKSMSCTKRDKTCEDHKSDFHFGLTICNILIAQLELNAINLEGYR